MSSLRPVGVPMERSASSSPAQSPSSPIPSTRSCTAPTGDMTELREHPDIVTKLLAELERSNTNHAQFAEVASHDLVQPLTAHRRRGDVTLCR